MILPSNGEVVFEIEDVNDGRSSEALMLPKTAGFIEHLRQQLALTSERITRK